MSDYTAYDRMRELNKERWNVDAPYSPDEFQTIRVWKKDENGVRGEKPVFEKRSELEEKAIRFIRQNCTGLLFKKDSVHKEMTDFDGKSLVKKQIPYNFEKDIDRRCLEVAIHRFMESGMAKDAFDVYFCYIEMFIGSYGKTKKMIEMLSEFEANASSLLMKHRDHYSHSVYVFIIGLAFYYESETFRFSYQNAYKELMEKDGFDSGEPNERAAHFLKYWGLSSLFHDIGYRP